MIVGWFGYGGNHWLAEQFRDVLAAKGIQLRTCHEYANATVEYHHTKINEFIDTCDVIILPQREVQYGKGGNRLAQAWSRKKPVVISPLPSYMKFARHEENALVCTEYHEFPAAIERLKNDPVLREYIAENGKHTAEKYLSPNTLYQKILNRVVPQISIIIPHYAPRTDYLQLAINSALKSSPEVSREIIVVSSANKKPLLPEELQSKIKLIYNPTRLNFSQANNLGLAEISSSSSHILLLNDDAILSHTALRRMLDMIGDEEIILNPYSNCDMGWLHNDQIQLRKGEETKNIHPNMTIEELKGWEEPVFDHTPEYIPQKYKAPFCAMYATMMPRSVFEKVGMLSTEFSNGGEDADYSKRAERFGIYSYWTKAAFVFHFGGKTRKVAQEQNPQAHEIEDQYNNEHLAKKWPKSTKKRVMVWTGPAWETWDLDTPRTKGIGGSETTAIGLAQEAERQGHYVVMYGDHPRKTTGNIHLRPWTDYKPEEEYFDLAVFSRNANPVTSRIRAKSVVIWVHDIWLLSGQKIHPENIERCTKIACLSPWHRSFFMQHHKIPESKICLIPNGMDHELYTLGKSVDELMDEKVPGKLHYSSSPDRGLDNILYMLPWIKEKVPDVHLDVYYGFQNWKAAVKSRNDDNGKRQVETLEKELQNCVDIVHFKDRVNQVQLAEAWRKASLWLYPTAFWETFCCTAVEAMLTATPIICSNEAALETTVGNGGQRIQGYHPYSKEAREQFIDRVVNLLTNKDVWYKQAIQAREQAAILNNNWSSVWSNYWANFL